MPADPSRVVLVAHPSPDLYGSDRVLLETVSGLVRAGWRVVVTLPQAGPLIGEIERRGAETVLCPTPVLRRAALRPRGLVTLAREGMGGVVGGLRLLRRERPAVVYVNTLTIPGWILLARLVRLPVLVHVHEAEDWPSRAQRAVLMGPLRLATAAVANSRFTRRVLAAYDPRVAARTVVVPNPVPAPGAATPARQSPEGRLGYVGRLAPRKGVDLAIRALALLRAEVPGATLAVVGEVFPGYEWYRTELTELVAELGLGGAVSFHGFRSDVPDLLPGLDLVLVPSRMPESFGNVAVEAALAARPVVVAATGALPEAVADLGAAVVVPVNDPRALADAAAGLFSDWSRVRDRALADAALVRRRHDPALYGSRLAALVDRVVAP